MQAWEQIVKIALLGTERMPLELDILPNSIKESLEKTATKEDEALLLQSAALLSIYKKSGAIAPIVPDITPLIAPNETLPYCSPMASAAWRKIQTSSSKSMFLIELWLNKIIDNQWIVSPDIIVALLHLGTTKKGTPLREKISEVVGVRGQWMVQFNEKWNYALPSDAVALFHEGKSAERIVALRRIRRLTPNMARILLTETWTKESIKDRKAFLEIFSINFTEEDRDCVNQWKKETQYREYEPLLSIFQSNQSLEANLMSHQDLLQLPSWEHLPLYFEWSKDFSEFMLRIVYDSFHYVHFTRGMLLEPWAAHLHPQVLLEHIPNISDRQEQKFQWSEFCSKHLVKSLALRKLIHQF